ncbi:hypothetical protein D3C73_1068710 [compost metagenome]
MVLGNGRPLSYTASNSSRCSNLPRGTPLLSRMNSSNISISGFCSRKVRASCRVANEVVAQLMGTLFFRVRRVRKSTRTLIPPSSGTGRNNQRKKQESGGRAWRQCHSAQKASSEGSAERFGAVAGVNRRPRLDARTPLDALQWIATGQPSIERTAENR